MIAHRAAGLLDAGSPLHTKTLVSQPKSLANLREATALTLLAQEVARARGITTVLGLSEQLGVGWATANELWNRTFLRIRRRTLARACQELNCEPHYLLRLVPPEGSPRFVDSLPSPGRQPGVARIVLRVQDVARTRFDIKDISALARYIGLACDTAAGLWYDRIEMLDRDVLVRTVTSLGGPEALRQIVTITYDPASDVVHNKAGLAVQQ